MKYSRELKIGLVLVAAIFLLYFGMNFLKGLDIFSPMQTYVGKFEKLNKLETSSPVYIRGYKVGQVSDIEYDFSRKESFIVSVVINKDILLPQGSEMVLIADGLLGGAAVELRMPQEPESDRCYTNRDTLPTNIEGSIVDKLQDGLLTDIDRTINDVDSMVNNLRGQIADNQIKDILENVDKVTQDLTVTSAKLKSVMNSDVPPIVADAKETIANAKETMQKLNNLSTKVDSIDINNIVERVDTTLYNIQMITDVVNSKEGTIGMLLNDKTLYDKVNHTIVSADTLINDIKAHPKRYINISIFGGNDD